MRTRLVVGCMTGTSIDGLDAALVLVEGRGLELRAHPLRFASAAFDAQSGPALRSLAHQHRDLTAGDICAAATAFAELHIATIRELLAGDRADLLVIHGQTVFHRPPLSWQLLSPAPIVRALAAPLVYDLRAADLAAGGQGAPITPLADYVLFHGLAERRAIVNLGGFANYTLLPGTDGGDAARHLPEIRGGDICLCNQLLDAVARERWQTPCDEDGRVALTGRVHSAAFAALHQQLAEQAASGRSLGTADQDVRWIREFTAQTSPADMARTACEALATVIAGALTTADRIILAGGGALNRCLADSIAAAATRQRADVAVSLTSDLGVPLEQREAICMAVLGALCADRVPITLPQITGVSPPAPVAGCWVFPDGVAPADVFSCPP